jgi:hypothetical protein
MKKINVSNISANSNLGKELYKAIYSVACSLDATDVVVTKSSYNKYAELQLYDSNDCIAWRYPLSVNAII